MQANNLGRKYSVIIADDHPMVMAGFALFLESAGIVVLGKTQNAADLPRLYAETKPDVVILDMRFGSNDGAQTGIDVGKALLAFDKNAKIIFLSQFDHEVIVKETYKMGAKAYLTKNCELEELLAAIERAVKGQNYFMPRIAEKLASMVVGAEIIPTEILDNRELEIFIMMAKGMTNAEIAEQMELSIRKISMISADVKQKLNLYRQADLTKKAIKFGLIAI